MRLVQMRGVDLDLFQFDYDVTWAAFFMNADRTIYGRYGSRRQVKKQAEELYTLGSLKQAMQRALEVHAGYPANKAALKDKTGPKVPWKSVEKMPAMAAQFKDTTLPKNCIHCHHAFAGERKSLFTAGKPLTDRMLWVYPLPENIGLRIDPAHGTRVGEVTEDSPAARAGARAGDDVRALNGQPILSIADIQWVLQQLPEKTTLKLEVSRDGAPATLSVALEGPWRQSDLSWRESMWALRPGLWLVDLTPPERSNLAIRDDRLGLRIKWVLPKSPAKGAGFADGDVLVELDGKSDPMNESQVVTHVRQRAKPGTQVPVTVIRGGKRIPLKLPVE